VVETKRKDRPPNGTKDAHKTRGPAHEQKKGRSFYQAGKKAKDCNLQKKVLGDGANGHGAKIPSRDWKEKIFSHYRGGGFPDQLASRGKTKVPEQNRGKKKELGVVKWRGKLSDTSEV